MPFAPYPILSSNSYFFSKLSKETESGSVESGWDPDNYDGVLTSS